MEKKRKFNLYDIGMMGLIIVSLFCTSKYGVSFSWIVIPAGCIVIGACAGKIQFLDIHLYVALFFTVSVVSTFLSPIVKPQRDILSFFLLIGLFIVITGNVESKEKGMLYVKTYIIVGMLGSFLIIYNFLTGNFYNEWFQRSTIEIMDVARDPNYVGAFIAPVPALMLIFRPIKNKLINIGMVFVVFIALTVCGSRGALISSIIPLFFYFLFKIKSFSRKLGALLLISLIILLAVNLAQEFLPEQTIDRLLLHGNTVDNRTSLWKAALGAFWDYPIIGAGMNSSSYYSIINEGNYSHSLYIDILSTGGIIGTLFYLLIMIKASVGKRNNIANMFILTIPFYLPQFFINGFNTMTMWLPIFMIHYCANYLDNMVDKQQEI